MSSFQSICLIRMTGHAQMESICLERTALARMRSAGLLHSKSNGLTGRNIVTCFSCTGLLRNSCRWRTIIPSTVTKSKQLIAKLWTLVFSQQPSHTSALALSLRAVIPATITLPTSTVWRCVTQERRALEATVIWLLARVFSNLTLTKRTR